MEGKVGRRILSEKEVAFLQLTTTNHTLKLQNEIHNRIYVDKSTVEALLLEVKLHFGPSTNKMGKLVIC